VNVEPGGSVAMTMSQVGDKTVRKGRVGQIKITKVNNRGVAKTESQRRTGAGREDTRKGSSKSGRDEHEEAGRHVGDRGGEGR
jgi:hypothetical protein